MRLSKGKGRGVHVLPVRELREVRVEAAGSEIRCPKCKTVLDESHPVCETCGWRLPLPPGAKASPRGAREAG